MIFVKNAILNIKIIQNVDQALVEIQQQIVDIVMIAIKYFNRLLPFKEKSVKQIIVID
jgi:hypothetical protein